jgi:hypothetical protein
LKLKRTWSFKDNISEDQQQNITKIIEDIRQEIQNDDFEKLKSQVEDLKRL